VSGCFTTYVTLRVIPLYNGCVHGGCYSPTVAKMPVATRLVRKCLYFFK